MHLLDIKADNLMGRSFHHGLSKVNLIIGRNDTGKTAILNAIRLLFTDKLVDQRGKQIRAMELASGPSIVVEGNTSDGENIVRSWGKKKASEGMVNLPPVLLDSRVYFNLSPGERTKFVFERFAGEIGTTRDEILASIQSEPIKDATPDTETSLRSILSDLRTAPSEIRIFLDSALVKLEASVKSYKEVSDRMASTIAGLTQLDAQYATAPTNVQEIKDQVAKLRALQAELSEKIGALKKTAADYAKKCLTADRLKTSISACPDHSVRLVELEQLIASTEAALPAEDSKTVALHQHWNAARENHLSILAHHKELSTRLDDIKKRKEHLLATGECPFCKSKVLDVNESGLDTSIQNIEYQIKGAEQIISDRAEICAGAAKGLQDAQNKDTEVAKSQAALRSLRNEQRSLITKSKERMVFESDLAALGDLIAPDTTALIELESQYRVAVTDAQKLDQDLVLAGNASNHKLRMLQSQKEKATADAGLRGAKMVQEKLIEARDGMVKKVIESLIVKTDPFLKDIVNFKLAFKDGDIGCWRPSGQLPESEIGRDPNRKSGPHLSNWVPHDLFSGIQQALTYAALSVALASDSPFKLVIVDEVTRFDAKNKALFLAKMNQAVREGVVDQVFLCDTTEAPYQDVIAIENVLPGDPINIISTDPTES